MTKPPPIDVVIEGDKVYAILSVALVRERGRWVGVETLDGEVIGNLFPHRVEKLKDVMDAVAEAERPVDADVLADERLEARRVRHV